MLRFFRLLAAVINSLYSFWWDVTNDWGLELLKYNLWAGGKQTFSPRPLTLRPASTMSLPRHKYNKPYPFGLRPILLFPLSVYPLVVFLNLILRLTWSIKLSSHLHSRSDGGELIFWLEVAEVVRRWMWVFVRVEWEIARKRTRVEEEEEYELVDSDQYSPVENVL
jgi:hypothetical protein